MLTNLMAQLSMLRNREDGQAMVEYALILALVSIVAIGVLTTVGQDVSNVLSQVAASL